MRASRASPVGRGFQIRRFLVHLVFCLKGVLIGRILLSYAKLASNIQNLRSYIGGRSRNTIISEFKKTFCLLKETLLTIVPP